MMMIGSKLIGKSQQEQQQNHQKMTAPKDRISNKRSSPPSPEEAY
eukprot:CAMPEP_0206594666 /NCGR_PEP_ID=MMETSP0325_2-20121206/42524_1 /ASSEMBLY_ACC=CAM_ASM_000347 /TAXON_ID=2866 /ORGANISM="Crypthecodinium cohnii, Strain Seligo" /LENGTH=44 /DNA_ID= /DNA_START= /DNA_END= /DNA_ORIENTATION=